MAKRTRKPQPKTTEPAAPNSWSSNDDAPPITATIQFAEKRRFSNLLHAVFALHDSFMISQESITFGRADGMTFHVNFCFNYVWFGPNGATAAERLWTENISIGTVDELLRMFIDGRDDALRGFDWLVRPRNLRTKRLRPSS